MLKKILINLSPSIWPMLGYEIDLIQQKLNEGHIVKILHCDGSPDFCTANNFKFISNQKINFFCKYCKSKLNNGINWLDNKKNLIIENFDLLNIDQNKIIIEYDILLKKKKNIDNEILLFLKNINEEIYNICKTTIIMEKLSTNLDFFEKKNFDFFKKISKSTIAAFYSSLNHLQKFIPDELYIYNGRMYKYQPMLRLAQSKIKKENIYVYEFPVENYQNMLILKKNYIPDLKNFSHELFETHKKNNINFSTKEIIAKKWISDRVSRVNYKKEYYPWKNTQEINSLPKSFNKNNFNISYFVSSEYEYFGIKENEEDYDFKNNLDIINEILRIINSKPGISLNIRCHPNSGNDIKSFLKELQKIEKIYRNIKIIEPDSKIDSYELIKNSDLIITICSTIGIEAAYFGKNVLNVGNSPYEKFNATKKIINRNDLNLLLQKCLIEKKFDDFPSNKDKYIGAVNYIYNFINLNYKSKFLIKKNYKENIMLKNNIFYKLDADWFYKLIFLIISLIRFFFKKIKIYI